MQPVYSQKYHNSKIDQILLYSIGLCEIRYTDGSRKSIPIPGALQYGLPLSKDGRILFVSSLENGLTAYDLENASILWRYRTTRITKLLILPAFVIAVNPGTSLLKLGLSSGRVLDTLKSATIDNAFLLNDQYLLADSIGGNVCTVDIARLRIATSYDKEAVNPNQCPRLVITDANLTNHTLTISGFEAYSAGTSTQMDFTRILDNHFLEC